MSGRIYDDYGRTEDDPYFGQKSEVPEPYMVDTSNSNVTYICFDNTPVRCVRRISKNGGLTLVEFSIGTWENRTMLAYQPINTTWEILE